MASGCAWGYRRCMTGAEKCARARRQERMVGIPRQPGQSLLAEGSLWGSSPGGEEYGDLCSCRSCRPCRVTRVQSANHGATFGHADFESWREQKSWADAHHSFSAEILASTLPPRMALLRELASGAHASSWLTVPTPQHPAQPWCSADWQLLLRWRLGMPLPMPRTCVACAQHQDF